MTQQLLGNLRPGILFVLSAPAGTGKTTLVQLLTHEFSSVIASISSTTRQPRPGEINDIDYHFLSREDFIEKIANHEFLEHVELYGDFYGTSLEWVRDKLMAGKHVILVIDTQGAMQLKEKFKAVFIFVSPPSFEELERRLRNRKTESAEMIEKRLDWAKKEILFQKNYDYCLVNDDLAIAYQTLRSILIAEERRVR